MRGKAAAQNANRRASDAQERIAELESRLRDAETRHRAECGALRTELGQVRGRLVREVEALSREAINAAELSGTERVQSAEAAAAWRVHNTIRFLSHYIPEQALDLEDVPKWMEFTGVIGVPLTEVLGDLGATESNGGSRAVRRLTSHRRGCGCGCSTPIQLVKREKI